MRAVQRPLLIGTAAAVAVALVTPGTAQAAPKSLPQASASSPSAAYIVLMKSQSSATAPGGRTSAYAATQAPVVAAARHLGAKNISQFSLINGLAATLDSAQLSALRANPAVASIVPDLPITMASLPAAAQSDTPATTPTNHGSAAACPSTASKPLLEPEALQTMQLRTNNGTVGAQKYTTGTGVKVAFLADGIDIHNPDFMRKGKSIFTDYRDFSTEGTSAASDAAEAFGDASSIAAQGNVTYNLRNDFGTAITPKAGCTIKVLGAAPGASLVGLKVFGNASTAPTSRFVQAIAYAVTKDHVDVINESFGGDPYPDTMNDPISLSNAAAVAAGVTVVASSGDAGVSNTIGSPASSSGIIAVAASTTYRVYAQMGNDGYNLPGIKGWASDNISALSSSGFAQNGKVPDVVAPGDLGWAVCTPNVDVFEGCTDSLGNPSSLLEFGGTSESSPLTAGVAALIISAYRKSHPGAGNPSPALVKQIITSTATDLGHPAQLQGSGEVNALAAVKAAMSVTAEKTGRRAISPLGSSVLVDAGQHDLAASGGTVATSHITVTNVSSAARRITASTRALSTEVGSQSGVITFAGTHLPTFPYYLGGVRAYYTKALAVPHNVDRLDFSIADSSAPGLVQVVLVSPQGLFSAYSVPQGAANYATVSVRYPAAGIWKAYLYSKTNFTGLVHYQAVTSRYARYGSVSPASTVVPAGKSATFTVKMPIPSQPGDTAASVQIGTASGVVSSVAYSLRSVVNAAARTASFTGVITGGNGRNAGADAESNTYAINVGSGQPNLNVGVKLAGQSAPNEVIAGYLVSPTGQTQGLGTNTTIDSSGDAITQGALSLTVRAPQAGRWRLVLETFDPVAGTLIHQAFRATVSTAKLTALTSKPLPNSTKISLAAGKPVLVNIRVHNSGLSTQTYFIDARLNVLGQYKLGSQVPGDNLSKETLPESDVTPTWLVPSETTSTTFTAKTTQPIQLDAVYQGGDPEVIDPTPGTTSVVTVSGTPLAPGPWNASAGVVGPFSRAAKASTVSYVASAHTRIFDSAVYSSTGDYWQVALTQAQKTASSVRSANRWVSAAGASSGQSAQPASLENPAPLTLKPGQSGTITVAIVPNKASRGKVVAGSLFLDTLDPYTGSGNELVSLPYTYRVK
jgi:hypothetical protein